MSDTRYRYDSGARAGLSEQRKKERDEQAYAEVISANLRL